MFKIRISYLQSLLKSGLKGHTFSTIQPQARSQIIIRHDQFETRRRIIIVKNRDNIQNARCVCESVCNTFFCDPLKNIQGDPRELSKTKRFLKLKIYKNTLKINEKKNNFFPKISAQKYHSKMCFYSKRIFKYPIRKNHA